MQFFYPKRQRIIINRQKVGRFACWKYQDTQQQYQQQIRVAPLAGGGADGGLVSFDVQRHIQDAFDKDFEGRGAEHAGGAAVNLQLVASSNLATSSDTPNLPAGVDSRFSSAWDVEMFKATKKNDENSGRKLQMVTSPRHVLDDKELAPVSQTDPSTATNGTSSGPAGSSTMASSNKTVATARHISAEYSSIEQMEI
jgi:hypothetical protein